MPPAAVTAPVPRPPGPRRRIGADAVATLWAEYHRTQDSGVRDRLVLTFAPLVKYIVARKLRDIPSRCDVEDFISCGLEALIQSIERYDPDKGATLEQYAWTRIHGAVLDELRRQDWAPRSVRRWERDSAVPPTTSRPCTAGARRPRSSPTPWASPSPSCGATATR